MIKLYGNPLPTNYIAVAEIELYKINLITGSYRNYVIIITLILLIGLLMKRSYNTTL